MYSTYPSILSLNTGKLFRAAASDSGKKCNSVFSLTFKFVKY